jgi:YgiT-type zinc finger domain-containing protein
VNLCPLCRVGDRTAGTTTITLNRGDATIVIRQVPALVCATCGEAALDQETAVELEQLAEQAIASGVRYELRDYVQKAVA